MWYYWSKEGELCCSGGVVVVVYPLVLCFFLNSPVSVQEGQLCGSGGVGYGMR